MNNYTLLKIKNQLPDKLSAAPLKQDTLAGENNWQAKMK